MRRAGAALLLALLGLPAAAAAEDPAPPAAEALLDVRVVALDTPGAGEPVEGARVAAARAEGEGPFDPDRILLDALPAGADGRARPRVPAGSGRVLVAAAAPGFAPALAFAPAEGGGPVVLALPRGRRADFEVLGRGPAREGEEEPAPAPLGGAALRLTPAAGYEPEGAPRLARVLRTGPDGRASLPDLALGPFFDLEVEARSWAGRRVPWVLAGGTTVRVTLEAAGRIAGRVLRVPGGGPVAGARVAAAGVEALTAEDGSWLLDGVPPGTHAVEGGAEGMLALDRPLVRVEAGRTAGAPDLRLAVLSAARLLLRGPGGRPVEGALLRLLPAEGAPAPPGPPAEARSDASGAARLAPLGPGAGHRVLVLPPEPLAPRVSGAFAVLPGEVIDLGLLLLDRGGVLSGTVLGPDGLPLPEASVTLFEGEEDPLRVAADPAAGGPLRRTLPVSPDGTFRFDRVPAGSRSLLARAPGRLPAAFTRIPVAAGEERGGLALSLRPGAALSGRLLDPEGRPVADALLTALAPPLDAEAGRARTAPDGTFLLEGLDRGAMRVRVLLPGEPFPDPLRPLFDAVVPSEGNEWRLPSRAPLEGIVTDPAGEEPRGFVVVARLERGPPGGLLLETAREVERVPLGPGGAFATRPLPEGRYRLRAESPDGRLAAADAEVSAGPSPRVSLVLSTGSSVRGRVVTGPLVEDLRRVSLRLLLGGKAEGGLPPAVVEESGAFSLHGVPAGEHDLVVSLPGLAPVVLRNIVVPPEGGVLDLGDVLLGQGATLRLRVYDGNRAPWAGVEAAVVDDAGLRREETTGGAGMALFGGLAPGPHLLEVRLPTGALLRRPIDAPADGEFEEVLDLGLDPPGTVTVRRAGGPVPGAAVRVLDAVRGAGAYAASAEVAADHRGVARVPGLPEGPVLVEVTPPGEPPVRLSLEASRGALEVDLPADGIEGRVVAAADGSPVPGASVRAWSPEPAAGDVAEALRLRGFTAAADGAGRFRFPSLPAGPWVLEASGRGLGTARTGPVRVLRGGGATPVEIALARAGRVAGTVRDGAGRPVPGAFVEATDTATGALLPGGRARADAAGSFALGGLAPGPLVLTARAGGIGASPPEPLSLAPGEERTLDLSLLPGGTLEILVVGPGAAPLPDASVEVRDFLGIPVPLEEGSGGAGAPLRAEGRTGPDGRLRVPGIRAGVYRVRAWKGGVAGESRVRLDPLHGARTVVAILPPEED